MSDDLKHYGMPRRSGRYPWGSGKDPYQRYMTFMARVKELEDKGFSRTEIAKDMGMKTPKFRAKITIASNEIKKADAALAQRLFDKGYSKSAIGRRMGRNESSVREMLDPVRQERLKSIDATSSILIEEIEKHKYIDVGSGVEQRMGISDVKLKAVVANLEEQGYKKHYLKQRQMGTGEKTTVMVLTKADVPYSEVRDNKKDIAIPMIRSEDGGLTYNRPEPPVNIDSKRIDINFQSDKDGVIELRRGVNDISLNNAHYAQVRIAVDGTHYLKGMAIYGENLPTGIDVVFNTNKKPTDNKLAVMKPQDPNHPLNPFGAAIKEESDLLLAQRHYLDPVSGEKKLSALNIVNEEGNWGAWSKSLSSQMLSKQVPALAKKQLAEAFAIKQEEFDEIMTLTNPAVKQKLLASFADDCDSAAVHLKAASLPRQKSQVIIPITSMKEDQVFAPNFRNGEQVVLIRYPHGGRFEIPELIVNNNQSEAKSLLSKAKDAIGIHPKVAERLSGADFDGDTVLVIPNNDGAIKSSAALRDLKNFNPREQYKAYPGMVIMTDEVKANEMGRISNLITDMTIKGSTLNSDKICRAIKHSMVVIDAKNHELDYKRSYDENCIAALKEEFQGSSTSGAATIISKAGATVYIDHRKEGGYAYDPKTGARRKMYVDPTTGKKLYTTTGETYNKYTYAKSGKRVDFKELSKEQVNELVKDGTIKVKTLDRKTKTTRMAETDDAFSLSSGTVMETHYAAHANQLKALALKARKEAYAIELEPVLQSAKDTYSKERISIGSQLKIAKMNQPLERKAQMLSDTMVKALKSDNPGMDEDTYKKQRGRALTTARRMVGAGKTKITISDSEWTAIQAGAFGKQLLKDILNNTDMEAIKQRAMPRSNKGMSAAKVARAKSMLAKGETQADVADLLGVSVSVLMTNVK
jgi:hypothetical protein